MKVEQPEDYNSKTSPRLEILFKGESVNKDTVAFPYVKETGRQIALERLYAQTGDKDFNRAIRRAYWTTKEGQKRRRRDPLAARLEEVLNPSRVAKHNEHRHNGHISKIVHDAVPVKKEIRFGQKRITILLDEVI